MQRQDRAALNELVDKIADMFGVTAEEIHSSERFEQMVYDFAKSDAMPDEIDVSKKAGFTVNNNTNRIEVTYRLSEIKTKELAAFYHRHFPETVPEFVYGMQQKISFLTEPFTQKVLPTMKLWRTRPSCVSDNSIDYVDSSSMLLRSYLTTEPGSAIFITGADSSLGEWKTALRLNFNTKNQSWECKLPETCKGGEFKFLIGSFDLGENANVGQLTYQTGDNRMLIIHAPATANRELPNQAPQKPAGLGVRC